MVSIEKGELPNIYSHVSPIQEVKKRSISLCSRETQLDHGRTLCRGNKDRAGSDGSEGRSRLGMLGAPTSGRAWSRKSADWILTPSTKFYSRHPFFTADGFCLQSPSYNRIEYLRFERESCRVLFASLDFSLAVLTQFTF